MKKLLALLLAAMMLISLAACGGDEPTPTTTEAPVNENNDPAPTGNDEPATEETTLPAANLTVHENTFFTVGYDPADGWILEEDDIYMSEYGGDVYLRILDEDEYTDVLVQITAYQEDAPDFRETLHANSVDLKAYAEGTWATESIGGLQMAAVEKDDNEWYFFDRNVEAGISYEINATDRDNPVVNALLANITFTASGTDNIDPPWPWEGEPFSGGTVEQVVGTYTLTAQFLPMAEAATTFETFDHDIAVVGDKVYVLSDCVLSQYAYDGAGLSFVKEIPLDAEYEILEKGADSNIILSSFMEPVIGHNGDAVQFSYEGPEKFTVAPDGTWGVSWFSSGDECQLYTFTDGALTGTPLAFPEVDTISQLCIDSKYILVSGSSVEDSEHNLFVYNHSGELQLQLTGDPDGYGLGSITYAVSTDNGFLALDGNMREVVLWTADGTWVGAVDDGDLFGTTYPWIAAADMAEDGSIFIVMSDTRADESSDEVLVFKLSGF